MVQPTTPQKRAGYDVTEAFLLLAHHALDSRTSELRAQHACHCATLLKKGLSSCSWSKYLLPTRQTRVRIPLAEGLPRGLPSPTTAPRPSSAGEAQSRRLMHARLPCRGHLWRARRDGVAMMVLLHVARPARRCSRGNCESVWQRRGPPVRRRALADTGRLR